MKIEFELPELPGYEYTGEFRPPVKGEVCLKFGAAVTDQDKYNTFNFSYPILREKGEPKILIYQWLINHNTNNDGDVEDCGYRVIYATEDHVVSMCNEFGWA
jgi:hypothetical protein